MARIHNVLVGDRITNLSIKFYGTASKASLIVNGNPQIKGRPISLEGLPTIYPGDVLIIPEETGNIVNFPEKKSFPETIAVNKPGEISFLIEGKTFSYFTGYSLNQNFDSFDNISFSVPYDENKILFQITFEPFSYKDIGIYYNGNIVFGGTIINSKPRSTPESNIIDITCYPKCGVLNDCNVPISLYPIEFEDQDLEQITNKLLIPFGIDAIFDESPGNSFKRVAPEPEQRIYGFLAELAKQRGIIISNTPQGNLLYWKANTDEDSVANLKEGERPYVSCIPNFNDQLYYSHITGFLPTKLKKDAEKYTWENPFLKPKGILRPFNFVVKDSESGDLKSAVEQKAGRMFGSVCSYTLKVQDHFDQNGNLWRKNTTVNVLAPGAKIDKDTKFLIKSVNINRTSEGGDFTVMNIVLPGSYSGTIPTEVPWGL